MRIPAPSPDTSVYRHPIHLYPYLRDFLSPTSLRSRALSPFPPISCPSPTAPPNSLTNSPLPQVNFAPDFIGPPANLSTVADHISHIARVTSPSHVGLGSDFDGIPAGPTGLEDVSKYPALFVELYKRGWKREELAGLAGKNLLRVWAKAELVSQEMQREGYPPAMDIYDKRPDLPMEWPGDEL